MQTFGEIFLFVLVGGSGAQLVLVGAHPRFRGKNRPAEESPEENRRNSNLCILVGIVLSVVAVIIAVAFWG